MDNYTPRLKEMYVNTIVPKLKNDLSIKNDLALPKLVKVSLNMFNETFTNLGRARSFFMERSFLSFGTIVFTYISFKRGV